MKVKATSKKLKASKGNLGTLKIPIIGLQISAPINFGIEAFGDWDDPIDEERVLSAYEAKIATIAPKLASQVTTALTQALQSSSWTWNDGVRDIYDTGELARSVSVKATGEGIDVFYSAPYANLVHNGGYIQPYGNPNARPVYMPPRPWVSSVLYGGGPVPQFDFDGFIRQELS